MRYRAGHVPAPGLSVISALVGEHLAEIHHTHPVQRGAHRVAADVSLAIVRSTIRMIPTTDTNSWVVLSEMTADRSPGSSTRKSRYSSSRRGVGAPLRVNAIVRLPCPSVAKASQAKTTIPSRIALQDRRRLDRHHYPFGGLRSLINVENTQ